MIVESDMEQIKPVRGVIGWLTRVTRGPVARVEVIESQAEFEEKFGPPRKLVAHWSLEKEDVLTGMLIPVTYTDEHGVPLVVIRNSMRGYSAWSAGTPGAKPGMGWTEFGACKAAHWNLVTHQIAREMAEGINREILKKLGQKTVNPDYYGLVRIV